MAQGRTLGIVAPEHFRHADELPAREANEDPRSDQFDRSDVVIDLRSCSFLRPAAVSWTAIYPLLARLRGSSCRLLIPQNMGVCIYLRSLGLFDQLKSAGVDIDDRGIGVGHGAQVVLPLTRFDTEIEVEDLANRALDSLGESGLGSTQLHPVVSEVFAELALNAVQHSESSVGAYGLIQFYDFDQGQRFVCTVADGGIGIRQSLEKNPELADRFYYDWDAIELAIRERVSGLPDKSRGIGLFGVSEDMRKPGRQLTLHSGQGMLSISERVETRARRVRLFPGTLAFASLPT